MIWAWKKGVVVYRDGEDAGLGWGTNEQVSVGHVMSETPLGIELPWRRLQGERTLGLPKALHKRFLLECVEP